MLVYVMNGDKVYLGPWHSAHLSWLHLEHSLLAALLNVRQVELHCIIVCY
jgi:hypothetical protein